MAKNKSLARKLRLIKANKQRSAVPTWVVGRTLGRVRTHPKKRNWRNSKLKV
ncbi:MAG: 50S ribosomal protein L39e [Candidatus Bathyarchaeia archaeon]